MVSDRSLEVLRVIVQDYVASREPVGSKSIVDRHAFGVSAATIRLQTRRRGTQKVPHALVKALPRAQWALY